MTRSQTIALTLVLLAGLAVPMVPGQAHHSFAMFDPSKATTINGTVKEFQWTNPHVVLWVYAAAKEGETPELWNIELTSPGNLTRIGWTRHSLNPGDKVAVEFAPLRDGTRGGGFRKVTLTDTGQELTGNFQATEKPDLQ
jgi:Family of unknown function (DUF6152)